MKVLDKKRAIYVCIYIVYCILVFWPIFKMGITCNDDLQWRLYATDGLKTLSKKYMEASLSQGRVLSCVQIISLWISCFPHRVLYGIIKVFFFEINIILLARILWILCSKKVAYLYLILMPVMLQVTLQHTPPDAFSMFIVLPACYFLGSLLVFNEYLNKKKSIFLIVSLILYFLSICSYEVFILYSPLFLVFALHNEQEANSFYRKFLKIKWHILVGGVFLGLYLGQRYVFPSNYEGNKIAITSVKETLSLQKMLIKSGIPGIYIQSGRGKYLFQYILNFPTSLLENVMNKVVDCRILVLLLIETVLLVFVMKNKLEYKFKNYFIALFMTVIYVICPPILNAISPSWMALGDVTDIIGLPVSYLISLAVVIGICIFVDFITNVLKGKIRFFTCSLVLIILLGWGGIVQIFNTVYSSLQVESADRVEHMEKVLNTDVINNLENPIIYSQDMCNPYVMQCANAMYWDNYVYYNNLNIRITDQPAEEFNYMKVDGKNQISWLGKNAFVRDEKIYTKEVCIFSENMLIGKRVIYETQTGYYGEISCQSEGKDNHCWITKIIFNEPVCMSNISLD